MPNVSASTIRTAINTKLGEVTQLDGGVSIGRVSAFSGFPACRFYLTGVHNEKDSEDTANVYRVYEYSVDVVMSIQIDGQTKAASEGEFEDAVDAVLDKLDSEWDLASIESGTIEPGQVRYEESAQGIVTYLPIAFHAKTLVSI